MNDGHRYHEKLPIRAENKLVRRLFERADHLGISNLAIARKLDRAPLTIRNWRAGVCEPSATDLVRLAGLVLAEIVVTGASQ